MAEEWREASSLSYKWQYKSLDGTRFFASPASAAGGWRTRADYPLRYFFWKINRDAWQDLEHWRFSERTVRLCVEALKRELDKLNIEIAESELEDSEPRNKTLIETRTDEIDADEILLESLEEDWFNSLVETTGFELEWDMLTTVLALLHVAEGVKLLDIGDVHMAGAHAVKGQHWLLFGRFLRGRATHEWLHKRQLAMSGADAAHAENRRLRKLAIERYSSKTWPSKMQAARIISAEVNKTELVVLRWIREHTRKE